MSIILSLSRNNGDLWAAGPEGLFTWVDGALQPIAQPQQNLYCCCAIHDRILVGGLPHGVAFSLQRGENWQAGWMDNVDAPVLSLSPDPLVEQTGVLLAGTDGGGVLRTTNRGNHWYTRNYGLRSFTILAIAWAPPAPAEAWPRWQTVFACTEEGIYHSPNGGRGWKRSECAEAVYQTLAIAPDFHTSGFVLAGTEGEGLFRSTNGGHSFQPAPDAPQQINALAATGDGWLLSDENHLWQSKDGLVWEPVANSQSALVLLATGQEVVVGNEEGLVMVNG
jgi:photosystem II stability/assembly factor-like uncharacterized protein